MFNYILQIYKLLFQNNFNSSPSETGSTDNGKTIGIFASGGAKPDSGGSGAKLLIEKVLDGEITGVGKVVLLSNHVRGGVSNILTGELKERTNGSNIAFEFQSIPDVPERVEDKNRSSGLTEKSEEGLTEFYVKLQKEFRFDYRFLSGWLKIVSGFDFNTTVNIHPGPLGEYGGEGMHGMAVHEKIWEDYKAGKINQTCVTMHFVTPEFDKGPIIAQIPVSLYGCTCPEDVQKRVNAKEHAVQWQYTQMIIAGEITWSGVEGEPVSVPTRYSRNEPVNLQKGLPYDQKFEQIKKKGEYNFTP